MSWLTTELLKEATKRRFDPDDLVRYFTDSRKGKGRGIVLTPNFARGKVVNYDHDKRRYKVRDMHSRKEIEVHPRNLMPETIKKTEPIAPPDNYVPTGTSEPPYIPADMTPNQNMVQPFAR